MLKKSLQLCLTPLFHTRQQNFFLFYVIAIYISHKLCLVEHTLGNPINAKFYSSYSSKSVNTVFPRVAYDPTLKKKKKKHGTSVAVQWFQLSASTAEGAGLIPGQGTKIL